MLFKKIYCYPLASNICFISVLVLFSCGINKKNKIGSSNIKYPMRKNESKAVLEDRKWTDDEIKKIEEFIEY
jgi:hypothetical protein